MSEPHRPARRDPVRQDPVRQDPVRHDSVRHDLVRLHPTAWNDALAGHPDLAAQPLVAGWADRGWPLVARRRSSGDPAGMIAVGLPLPPSLGKRRLGLAVPPTAVAATEPPPRLAALQPPPAWRATVAALLALGRHHGCEPRAFGSFAFAHATGLDYLAATSDLDMLWSLTAATPALLAALAAVEAEAPGRLDGEVVDAQGRGVQWQELRRGLAGDGEVLVKTLDGVALVAASAFLGGAAA